VKDRIQLVRVLHIATAVVPMKTNAYNAYKQDYSVLFSLT